MAKTRKIKVDRRGFLKGAAAGAAATAVTSVVSGTGAVAQEQIAQRNATAQPNAATLAADTGIRPVVSSRIVEKPGLRFHGGRAQEARSGIRRGKSRVHVRGSARIADQLWRQQDAGALTCCHEESAVAMAHGYAKIEGKPMMALIHGTIGMQHASMAIYNAYADRVPVYMVVGNHADGAERASGVQSLHSAQDMGGLVRDYVKWDDQPYSLGHFAESAVRAYNIARTPPMGPVLITMNAELQLHPNAQPGLRIPNLSRTAPPQGDSAAVAQAAQWLVAAQSPMIMTERTARTPDGMKLMVELAETLQAPVSNSERMDFPNRHPLAGTGGPGYEPDVVICLEVNDVSNTARAARARNAKTISISSIDLSHKANIQEFGHYSEVDLDIGADAEATLPALIEQCRKLITPDRKRVMQERGAKIAAAHKQIRARNIELASVGWDASPVSLEPVVRRVVAANQGSRLVTGFVAGIYQRLAGAALEFRQALSIHRRAGCGRDGLWRTGGGWSGAGEQKTWAVQRLDPDRWRSELRAGRIVDGGASPHPVVDDHAQQPRLSPGSHVHRAGREYPQPRGGPGSYRHQALGSRHQLREDGAGVWDGRLRSDYGSEGSGADVQARHRAGEEGRTGDDRRRDSAALAFKPRFKPRKDEKENEQDVPDLYFASGFVAGGRRSEHADTPSARNW